MEGEDTCAGCLFLIVILFVSYLIISWIGVGGYLALIAIIVLLLFLVGISGSSDQQEPSGTHAPGKTVPPISGDMIALNGLRDGLDPESPEYGDVIKKITGYLRDSSDPEVRARAADYLGETGDAVVLDALREALNDPHETVRVAARRAIERLKKAQRPLKDNYGTLICGRDLFRPKKIRTREGQFVVCRVCGHSKFLEDGVKEVVGIIGDAEYSWRQEDRLFISMWDEKTKNARNADIDTLWITEADDLNYGWAINAVYQKLQNDVTRAKPISEISVIIKGVPELSEEEIEILQNFGGIKNGI
jgi:hypothetical protein